LGCGDSIAGFSLSDTLVSFCASALEGSLP
jgi:hypothetical protein